MPSSSGVLARERDVGAARRRTPRRTSSSTPCQTHTLPVGSPLTTARRCGGRGYPERVSFGLTFDKLLIIGIIAVFLLGPGRLPYYASQLARLVRIPAHDGQRRQGSHARRDGPGLRRHRLEEARPAPVRPAPHHPRGALDDPAAGAAAAATTAAAVADEKPVVGRAAIEPLRRVRVRAAAAPARQGRPAPFDVEST